MENSFDCTSVPSKQFRKPDCVSSEQLYFWLAIHKIQTLAYLSVMWEWQQYGECPNKTRLQLLVGQKDTVPHFARLSFKQYKPLAA